MDGGNSVIIALVSALFGGGIAGIIGAIINWRKSKHEIKQTDAQTEKTEADTAEVITRAAGEVARLMEGRLCAMQKEIDALRKENGELRDRVSELEDRFDEVLAGAHLLYAQVVENGTKPKYCPPERRKKP